MLLSSHPATHTSAAKNLIFASASSGFTKPVGCTWTHSRSMHLAPIASWGPPQMSISRPKRATDDNHMALIKEDLLMGLQAAIVEDCRPCNCKKSIHLFPFQLQSLFDLSSLHLRSSPPLAPLAQGAPILMPSPVQCSPLVVGRCSRSGRYCASSELLVKSAPKPPVRLGRKKDPLKETTESWDVMGCHEAWFVAWFTVYS